MLGILGLLIAGVSVWSFWYLLPKNGQVHRLMTMPYLDQYLPASLICGLALGIGIFISAFNS